MKNFKALSKYILVVFLGVIIAGFVQSQHAVAQTPPTTEAACKAAGGIWKTSYVGSILTPSCKILPTTGTPKTKEDCIEIGGTWTDRSDSCSKNYGTAPGEVTDSGAAAAVKIPPYIPGEAFKKDCDSKGGVVLDESNCEIIRYLNMAFDVVSGIVVLGVIANIIISGIMYSMAQGEPSAAAKAKGRIQQGAVALLMYFALYGFIQWLIPGGAF